VRAQIEQLFLKQVGVRKLGDIDMDAGLLLIIFGSLTQRVAFNS
jgi:hypothetical protein